MLKLLKPPSLIYLKSAELLATAILFVSLSLLRKTPGWPNIQSVKSKGDFVGGWDWFLPEQPATKGFELLR